VRAELDAFTTKPSHGPGRSFTTDAAVGGSSQFKPGTGHAIEVAAFHARYQVGSIRAHGFPQSRWRQRVPVGGAIPWERMRYNSTRLNAAWSRVILNQDCGEKLSARTKRCKRSLTCTRFFAPALTRRDGREETHCFGGRLARVNRAWSKPLLKCCSAIHAP